VFVGNAMVTARQRGSRRERASVDVDHALVSQAVARPRGGQSSHFPCLVGKLPKKVTKCLKPKVGEC
jgi:hypothetical protein